MYSSGAQFSLKIYSSGAPISKFSINIWISVSPILQCSITLICGPEASNLEFNASIYRSQSHSPCCQEKKEGAYDKYIERNQSNERKKSK